MNSQLLIDNLVKAYGEYITGQTNMTYSTREALERYDEMCKETDTSWDEEMFLEYFLDNISENLRNLVVDGGKYLRREISVISEDGDEIIG